MSQCIDFSKVIDCVEKRFLSLHGIYLFGSYASGDQTEASDIDLALLAPQKIMPAQLAELSDDLAILLQINQVDVVDLKAVNIIFQEEILKTGKRIATFNWHACEIYEDYIYCKAMGFREWRKPWLAEIVARGSVYG